MRPALFVVLLVVAPGCEPLGVPSSEEVARLEADQAALTARVEGLEARLAALESPAVPASVTPPPVAPPPPAAPSPRPERPLAIPAVPVPPPAPVAPAGPVGKVTVSSPRDGASITVDGVLRPEKTPAVLMLPPGRHTVEVQGYGPQEIRVIEGESVLVVPR